jgi:CubicO group peptidase (beta-lactamase class C family)
MLLNGGAYGGQRILSAASVAAMTRHQVDPAIPWVMPRLSLTTGKRMEFVFRGGGYGYGLFLFGPGDRFRANGALQSRSAFGHLGFASACVWADPERELLGVYLGVAPRLIKDLPVGPMDLFQNVVHAAVVD